MDENGPMRHAILGAGAIGGMLGTALASLGHEVSMVVRREKVAGYPRELTLDRPNGTLKASAKAISELTEPTDVLWIATKTYQLEEALQSVIEVPRAIVPLLNGVDHVAVLRSRYSEERSSRRRSPWKPNGSVRDTLCSARPYV